MKYNIVNESLEEHSADKIYQNSLDDSYWREISKKFPEYNSKESQTNKAVKFILNHIKKKYNVRDSNIMSSLKNKIHSGIT